MTINNPVLRGFNPDPSICRKGNDFYIVTSTFEYFPAVPIYHSTNLAQWEQIGFCITDSNKSSSPSTTGLSACKSVSTRQKCFATVSQGIPSANRRATTCMSIGTRHSRRPLSHACNEWMEYSDRAEMYESTF